MKKIIVCVVVITSGLLLIGGSSEKYNRLEECPKSEKIKKDIANLPDFLLLKKWVNEQDWSKYLDGGTTVSINLNGEVVIGVGIVDLPRPTRRQSFLFRSKASLLARDAIGKLCLNVAEKKVSKKEDKDGVVSCSTTISTSYEGTLQGLITVFSEEVVVNGRKKYIVVVAKKK